MGKRFVSIWFRYLHADWYRLQKKELQSIPFVIAAPVHGRMMINAIDPLAENQGITVGMTVADARAIFPDIKILDEVPGLYPQLLKIFSEWCIKFTPFVSIDGTDGLFLDATGCPHLWGNEDEYLADINKRFNKKGFNPKSALASTMGAAWAFARFLPGNYISIPGADAASLLTLPPEALKLEMLTIEKLHKLGLKNIQSFIQMPSPALKRRFGIDIIRKINYAFGYENEIFDPVFPVPPYLERLPSLEPIVTGPGIEIALRELLEKICFRLQNENNGLRTAIFKCYRIDGKIEQVETGTNRPSNNPDHLFHLFEEKLPGIEPALGIELFILEAYKIEPALPSQEKLWEGNCRLDDNRLSKLMDRLSNKIGKDAIVRFVPDEHSWPERSYKKAVSLDEMITTKWKTDKPRPVQILKIPQSIHVAAPVPDYPPILFRYKNKVHTIIKADGPERIEREWWISDGDHRDYYSVEDEEGQRYWIFRSGHYRGDIDCKWFIHGFFS